MTDETRRCKHCGKTLIQANYWYCPDEVVYTPNMAAPANNPYVYPVYATGYPTEAYGMVFPTVNAANAAATSRVPTFICSHEPAEPQEESTAANVVTFREDDGTLIEAKVLETEKNLNWIWLRVDDGTAEGRWIRSDVVESFTMTNRLTEDEQPLGPEIHPDPDSPFWKR